MSRNVHLRQGGLKYRKIWWRNARYAIERNDAATGKRHRNSWGFYFAWEMVVGEPIRWQQLGIYARATQVSTGSEESRGGKHLREILGDLSWLWLVSEKAYRGFVVELYSCFLHGVFHSPYSRALERNRLGATSRARECSRWDTLRSCLHAHPAYGAHPSWWPA